MSSSSYLLLAYLACPLTCGFASFCKDAGDCPLVPNLVVSIIIGLFWPLVILTRFFVFILR